MGEGSGLNVACLAGIGQGRRSVRPGNAGGAKGPDFWCAFQDGRSR